MLDRGSLMAFLERGGRTLLTFDADPHLVAETLAGYADRRRRRLTLHKVDGEPAGTSPLADALRMAGFAPGYRGLSYGSRGRRA